MSKMSNHIVRQREAGIKEDLTEEILIVQTALLTEIMRRGKVVATVKTLESIVQGTASQKLMAYAKELEESWDRIKRRLKDDI